MDISREFAQELLRAMYGLDSHTGRLDRVCSALPEGALKSECKEALSLLMHDVLVNLMVPIYRRHRSLGTASQPGPWLTENAGEQGEQGEQDSHG